MDDILNVVLTALYLRGAPRRSLVKRENWRMVERSLRLKTPTLGAAEECLRNEGLWSEALALTTPTLLAWSENQIAAGRVLTAVCPEYPSRWLDRLGTTAPPAVWIEGQMPEQPSLTVVGSREVSAGVRDFARRCAAEALKVGFSVASGGAPGCDRAAADGATPGCFSGTSLVEIVPYGLSLAKSRAKGCRLSVCAPDEEFSVGTAMERNALLYAISEISIVVHARLKAGGSWHGAVEAHRRRLSRLLVRDDPRNPAHRALAGLGAMPLRSPEHLSPALDELRAQPVNSALL